MTPRDALNQSIVEAQARFRYIADAPTLDEWDTVREFEARGGGDCDGWTLWCLWRAVALCGVPGCWYFVRGTADDHGHAWAEIRDGGERLWADPTWGEPCHDPGWFTGREPEVAYPVDGEIMGEATAYLREGA